MTIEDYVLGRWDNVEQCSMYPTEFSRILVEWQKVEGGYESWQWRHKAGKAGAYRHNLHKFIDRGDGIIAMETYNSDWTPKGDCAILFTRHSNGWRGQDNGKCQTKDGAVVSTTMELFPGLYRVHDLGRKGNEYVFGGKKFYQFKRVPE
jgi:hypothetical protein